MMAETLELALLGNPEVRLAGQPLARFRSTKVYALLYYLAMTRRAQARTVLAGLFWGDIDEYYARRNFSRTLSDLTQSLGNHLVIERQSVAFAQEQPHWLDVAILESAATTTPTAHNVAALAAAANLYRGDFLDGFYVQDAPAFEQWVLTERTRLHAAVLQLLHTLADYEAGQGKLTNAMAYARRILQLEPWHEEAHRLLMLLLAQSGQRAAALAQFELCRQALHSELNVDPDADTLDLVAHIRAGKIDRVTSDRVTSDTVASDKVTERPPQAPAAGHEVTLSANPPVKPSPVSLPGHPPSPWHNLPSPLTTFVGRRSEIDTVKQLLKQHRLLTLTGPGGIGKTRLALQAAAEMVGFFPDGICYVELASINQAALVINTLAHLLGVKEALDIPLARLLQEALRDKEMLLVLDNFEHLLDAAALIADLLAAAPTLTVLTTSREVLALYGEQEYAVPPLQLPNVERFAVTQLDPSSLLNNESLQLFERSAQSVAPDFRLTAENAAAVASLCLRLDGLPLAIELAAAYVKLLSPQTILAQLDSMWLEMKRGLRNVPARQQTLRNAIEWSYRFLNEEEKCLFARLSIFRGGCTWEAISAICAAPVMGEASGGLTSVQHINLLETLNGLVSKSLVWRKADENGQWRFGMLETIREFAHHCLVARGEAGQWQQEHVRYYTEYTGRIEAELISARQRQILNQVAAEIDNLRAALRWAMQHEPVLGLRMIADLSIYWRIRGYLTEGLSWAEQLLAAKGSAPAAVVAKAYATTSTLALVLGQRLQARQFADNAWQFAHTVQDAHTRAMTLHARINTRIAPGLSPAEYAELIQIGEQAAQLYAECGKRLGYGRVVNMLGEVMRMQQRYGEAQQYFEESLRELRAIGFQSGITTTLLNLGWTAFHGNDYAAALAYFMEGVLIACELDYPHNIALSLSGLAGVLARLQRPQEAAKLLSKADAIRQATGIAIDVNDEADYERTQRELYTQLGSQEFDRCWQAGCTMARDAFIELLNSLPVGESSGSTPRIKQDMACTFDELKFKWSAPEKPKQGPATHTPLPALPIVNPV